MEAKSRAEKFFARNNKSRGIHMSLKIDGTLPGYNNCYHFQACPKYRDSVFTGEIAQRLEGLMREKSIELGWTIYAFAVDGDHAHFLIESEATPSNIAQRLFGYASRVLRQEFPELKDINNDHLWGGRQCKVILDHAHFENAMAYIKRHKQVL